MYIIVLLVYILDLIWGGQGDVLSHMVGGLRVTTCRQENTCYMYHVGATTDIFLCCVRFNRLNFMNPVGILFCVK